MVQYRTAERGDTLFAIDVAAAIARNTAAPAKEESDADKESDLTPGSRALATSPLRVDDLVTSPDGTKLAFISSAINQRQEKFEDYEIYVARSGESRFSGSSHIIRRKRSSCAGPMTAATFYLPSK